MHEFIQLIKSRSDEHGIAFSRIHDLPGSMMSILRQELDSLIRVLYLLSISDLEERNRLMACTVNGNQWKISTPKGKLVKVTDAQMVEVSEKFGPALSIDSVVPLFIFLISMAITLQIHLRLSPQRKGEIFLSICVITTTALNRIIQLFKI